MPKTQEKNQPSSVAKFWNIVTDETSDSAEITLYGDIVSDQPRDFWTGQAIEGNFITPQAFADDLAKCQRKNHVTVRLNSCGGDLFTGIAIHNALKGLSAQKTVIVEGIAASAASVIMCAGDSVEVYPGSIVMIHGVSSFMYDLVNLQDLKKMVKAMDTMENAVAAIYARKTGKETGDLRNLMTRETWMTGQEAIDAGFADVLLDGEITNRLKLVASAAGKFSLKAGELTLSPDFRQSIPDKFRIFVVNAVNETVSPEEGEEEGTGEHEPALPPAPSPESDREPLPGEDHGEAESENGGTPPEAETTPAPGSGETGEAGTEDEREPGQESPEDLESRLARVESELSQARNERDELKRRLGAADPGNSAPSSSSSLPSASVPSDSPPVPDAETIRAQAMQEERQRIAEIDSIAGNIDPQLVHEAKFGASPMTARDLAFRAMQTAQFGGQGYMAARLADFSAGGAGDVSASPGGGDPAAARKERLHAAIEAGKKASKYNQ